MDAVTLAPAVEPVALPIPRTVSVFAVAEHLLKIGGPMEATKLEALVYLSQAWHLAATGLPMFDEPIEAWAEGPVVPVLHESLGGAVMVSPGFSRNVKTTSDLRIS